MTRIVAVLLSILTLASGPCALAAGYLDEVERNGHIGPNGDATLSEIAYTAPRPLDSEPCGYLAKAHVLQGVSVAESTTTIALKHGRIEIGDTGGQDDPLPTSQTAEAVQ